MDIIKNNESPADVRKKENQFAEMEKQKILIEYIAMMTDVELPDNQEDNQEGESYE